MWLGVWRFSALDVRFRVRVFGFWGSGRNGFWGLATMKCIIFLILARNSGAIVKDLEGFLLKADTLMSGAL